MNGRTSDMMSGGIAPGNEILVPHTVTPGQFADTRKRADDSPYHELIYATLADAIEMISRASTHATIWIGGNNRPVSVRRLLAEDLAWVQDHGDAPFSFVWCCQALSIDPDVLRERLTSHNGHIVFSREQRGGKKSKISHSVRRSQVGPRRKSCEGLASPV